MRSINLLLLLLLVVVVVVVVQESLGSVVVRALDLQSTSRGFDSRPPHCRVATPDKSFTRAQRL